MASPVAIVAYLALFASVGILFVLVNLLVGYLLRPKAPNQEKLEIYECGEPTIGSSFVQFDLRFYVVALLFIIFDVEVAFFFPWATVFGKAMHLVEVADRVEASVPADQLAPATVALYRELGVPQPSVPELPAAVAARLPADTTPSERKALAIEQSARTLALISLADIAAFFAVLMVGFAYVWKRGDLDWVRAVSGERAAPPGDAGRTAGREPMLVS